MSKNSRNGEQNPINNIKNKNDKNNNRGGILKIERLLHGVIGIKYNKKMNRIYWYTDKKKIMQINKSEVQEAIKNKKQGEMYILRQIKRITAINKIRCGEA